MTSIEVVVEFKSTISPLKAENKSENLTKFNRIMKNEISVIFFTPNQQIIRCILIALVDASCNKACPVVLGTLSPY